MLQGRWGPRDLIGAGLGWLAGLALLHRCERLPTPAEQLMLAAGVVVLAWARRRWWGRVLIAALLAFLSTAWRAEQRLSHELAPAWELRDLVMAGRIDSLPVAVTGQGGVPGWRFEFAIDAVGDAGTALPPQVPPRLMLLIYDGPAVMAGERWRFTARLKRAHGLMNPGGFDAELWLFEQGLRATGVVRAAQRLEAAPAWRLDTARQRLRESIRAHVPDPALAGVLAALSLGDQNAIAGVG